MMMTIIKKKYFNMSLKKKIHKENLLINKNQIKFIKIKNNIINKVVQEKQINF